MSEEKKELTSEELREIKIKQRQAERKRMLEQSKRQGIDLSRTPAFLSLNVRQQLFVLALIEGNSQVDAYEKAGYARNKVNASKMANHEVVKMAIQELMSELATENIMSLEEALAVLTKFGYGEDVAEIPRDVEVGNSIKAIELIIKQHNIEDGKVDSLADLNITFNTVGSKEEAIEVMEAEADNESDE